MIFLYLFNWYKDEFANKLIISILNWYKVYIYDYIQVFGALMSLD